MYTNERNSLCGRQTLEASWTDPSRGLAWVPDPLWARRWDVRVGCAVRFCTSPTPFASGCRASEGLLCLDPDNAGCLWLCPLKLQRPCTSAVAPSIVIKVQRDLAVTAETSSPLFQDGDYLCSYLLLHKPAECGKCWKCALFPIEWALLKPSVKSLLACKIVGIFCEMPSHKILPIAVNRVNIFIAILDLPSQLNVAEKNFPIT